MCKKYCSPCWLSLFISSTEANSCPNWMQLHDPTNTLTTCNKLFQHQQQLRRRRLQLNWIMRARRDGGRAASANAKNEFTSDLWICHLVSVWVCVFVCVCKFVCVALIAYLQLKLKLKFIAQRATVALANRKSRKSSRMLLTSAFRSLFSASLSFLLPVFLSLLHSVFGLPKCCQGCYRIFRYTLKIFPQILYVYFSFLALLHVN